MRPTAWEPVSGTGKRGRGGRGDQEGEDVVRPTPWEPVSGTGKRGRGWKRI